MSAQDKTIKITIVVDDAAAQKAKRAIMEIKQEVDRLVESTQKLGGFLGGLGAVKVGNQAGSPGTGSATQATQAAAGGAMGGVTQAIAGGAKAGAAQIKASAAASTAYFKSMRDGLKGMVDDQDRAVRRMEGIWARFRKQFGVNPFGGGGTGGGGGGGGGAVAGGGGAPGVTANPPNAPRPGGGGGSGSSGGGGTVAGGGGGGSFFGVTAGGLFKGPGKSIWAGGLRWSPRGYRRSRGAPDGRPYARDGRSDWRQPRAVCGQRLVPGTKLAQRQPDADDADGLFERPRTARRYDGAEPARNAPR